MFTPLPADDHRHFDARCDECGTEGRVEEMFTSDEGFTVCDGCMTDMLLEERWEQGFDHMCD